jgi:translocation and assembly module TamB
MLTLTTLRSVTAHPLTQRVRRWLRRIVVTLAVLFAVGLATGVTVDLGPALKHQAEVQGSKFMKRPMHIGRLRALLWPGRFRVEDFVIEGLKPGDDPFIRVKQLDVSVPWSTLITRRIVVSSVEMTDWRMVVETFPDGKTNFPKLTPDGPRRPSAWTTTVQYVHAYRGETVYRDHGTPWNVVTRNLDLTIARTNNQYRGRARFSNGTVKIQNYEPFGAEMRSSFLIDAGRIVFDRIDLLTDGARTRLIGDADMAHFPEQMYRLRSEVDFATMRRIFFARESFELSGTGTLTGTFHLFKETLDPSKPTRTGRELKATFESAEAGVNSLRFQHLKGAIRWVPEVLEVTDASSGFYGGTTAFAYRMGPFGQPGVEPTYGFDATYADVDLTTLTNYLELDGLRLAGRASGRNHLVWPRGRFKDRSGDGQVQVTAPDGTILMTKALPLERIAARDGLPRPWGPFSNHLPLEPVAIGGELNYRLDPAGIDLEASRIATPDTYVEFQGRTEYGDQSRIPFFVASGDWQESDRLLAGILTAFGSRTGAIPIGGYGTFDGVMLESFSRPRIEGTFTGDRMRAWDVEWGRAPRTTVIENSYADVTDVVIARGDSEIRADGRFSLGYPRRDGGEEINARVRIVNRPVADLRHAFAIDDYDIDGLISGEFRVYSKYQEPLGFGTMSITPGVAYGEPFDTASALLRFEGSGVRLDNIQMEKGGGRGNGAAYVGWNGTYSFNLDAKGIPVENVALAKSSTLPLSGLIDFTAGGSGSFDEPRYDVRATIRDFFAADEGIGQVTGEIGIAGDLMNVKLEAASSRLAVSGAGRVSLTDSMDAEMAFSVSDTSLDPYIRALNPQLSPYTTAVASGRIRVVGALADIDRLLVDVTVDRLDVRLFDYQLRNAVPLRLALDRHAVRLADVRLSGEGTQLEVSGQANLHDDRIAVRVRGDANLGILQGFVPNMRSSGQARLEASLEGPIAAPLVTGAMTVDNGRFRHFSFPHALENISGPIRFDSRAVRIDEVTARLGGGPVQFGGTIAIAGYQPGRMDVTMRGQDMRLRFPEGMRSVVDADLAVEGSLEGAVLRGRVAVKNAIYTREFSTGGGFLDLAADATSQAGGGVATTVPLRYDIQLDIPSTLQVRNNAVRLTASANLQLRGTYDRPLVTGRADVEDGILTFEGRRYVLTRGAIDFNNPTRIDPFFDLEAETRVRVPQQTYRVTVRGSGTVDRIVPEVTSDPYMPQAEVLALLFGNAAPGQDVEFRQYSTDITPQQQLMRELATRQLTAPVSSEVGRVVEQAFGVDTFQLTPSLVDPNQQSSRLDPAARLVIGKRLSERLFLTYSRSLSSSTSDQILLLEYDQTDRFSWVLSRNEDRTYALDIRVRRTF